MYTGLILAEFSRLADTRVHNEDAISFPNAQKMLPWQPVWGNRQKWPTPHLFPALVFQNGLEDRNADAKRLNVNDSSTLCMGGARILT